MIDNGTTLTRPNRNDSDTVTVLAPTPQDAKYCEEILREHAVSAEFVASIYEVTSRIRSGAGVVLVAQEFLNSDSMGRLRYAIEEQPSWSDVPILVLLAQKESSTRTITELLSLGHVTLIERPLRIALLVSTLKAKIRDRLRQYEVRDLLLEARQASESKSAFVANMSHEIRTPLTSILGYTDLLMNLVQATEARDYLSTIRRNGEFLLGIINDILDLSKIEAGKLDIDLRPFDLTELIGEVLNIMRLRAAERDIQLNVVYKTSIPQLIESDPKRLKQILINLLGNAVKFTNEGEIAVSVSYERPDSSRDAGSLNISVSDTGIGMTVDQQQRLFKPFSQGDSAITQQFGGTGLGLDISQRLAVMLGGEICVDSTFSKGSTFTVRIVPRAIEGIPLIQPAELIESRAVVKQSSVTNIEAHVLIVDDRRDIRFLSKRILSEAGATITEAEDGLIAIAIAEQAMVNGFMFDLILLDIQMPNMNGYDTASALRKIGYTGPIIALTAGAMQGDMQRCLQAGCNDYLSKPIDKGVMLEKIGALLRK